MYAFATCTISIYRGTTKNEYGDDVADTAAPLYTDILAYIDDRQVYVTDLSDEKPRAIHKTDCTVPYNTDIRVHDRIHDNTYGIAYWVNTVEKVQTPGFKSDITVSLRRVN